MSGRSEAMLLPPRMADNLCCIISLLDPDEARGRRWRLGDFLRVPVRSSSGQAGLRFDWMGEHMDKDAWLRIAKDKSNAAKGQESSIFEVSDV